MRLLADGSVSSRAPHNTHQALIRPGDEKVTTLVERALGEGNVPAIAHAMTTMAVRFEQFVTFFMKQGSQFNWPRFKDFESFPQKLKLREFPA